MKNILILANDGIDASGKSKLQEAGFQIDTDNVAQDKLEDALKSYDAVLVRSATQIRKEIIDACPDLKLIGRGGVGMDNIDVEYARKVGIEVINTPAASSLSVAELVFSHLFGLVRFLPDSNRQMPLVGSSDFKSLKKQYSKGIELKGKMLGIIGLGRIGQEVAGIAFGIGMKVLACDIMLNETNIELQIAQQKISVPVKTVSMEQVLKESDFISMHVPFKKGEKPMIGKAEFEKMKDGVCIINCARGGCIDESSLIKALDNGKVAYAGIDVFEEEPTPKPELLKHPKVSLTPHIGASTVEAQERIGIELADKIIGFFKK